MANCDLWSYRDVFKDSKGNNHSFCGKKARVFYRLEYSSIRRPLDGITTNVIGLCEGHAGRFGDTSVHEFNHKSGKLEGFFLRSSLGMISSMTPVQSSEVDLGALEKSSKRQMMIAHIKSTFMRQMLQENRKDVTDDEWSEAFESALREFKVHQVMKE